MQNQRILAPLGIALTLSIATAVRAAEPLNPPPLPKTMISMGDSITAGAVASLSRAQFYNPLYLFKLLSTIGEIAVKWDAYSAIQDRHLSWASGLDPNFSVKSHAQRLAYLHAKAGTKMQVGSVSWSGDTSFNLEGQVNSALAWNKTRGPAAGPEYVTLLIGANDICADSVEQMSDDRDIYNNVDTAISRLVSANPDVKIVISSLPDVNSLNTVAKRSRLLGVYPFQRCEDFWRTVNLCKTLTRLDAGSLDRYIVGEKVVGMNRMYGEIADRINTQTQNHNVVYSPTAYQQKFTDDDISVDCFHPNQRGQNILAKSTWDDGFWREGWNDKSYDQYVASVKKARAKLSQKMGPPHHR